MRRSSRRLIESDGPRDKRARPARDVEETDLSAAGRSLATGGCHGTMRGQKLPSPVTSRPTLRSLFHIVKRRLRNKEGETSGPFISSHDDRDLSTLCVSDRVEFVVMAVKEEEEEILVKELALSIRRLEIRARDEFPLVTLIL